jgi:hypothetical protein
LKTMRRMALVLLTVTVACVAILVALIWWLGVVTGMIVGLAVAAFVIGFYARVLGPWQRRWGATDPEVRRAMPGDDILGPGAASTTRAITIEAEPHDVFPWLVQIGYGRGGWYSYDWLDNDGKPSADSIRPSLQDLSIGDRIEMLPGLGPTVCEIEPDHHLVSAGDKDSWCLLVEPAGEGRSRLISRWRQRWPKTLGTYLWIAIVDPGAFVMELRMLRTIRNRSERRAAARLIASEPD